MWFIETKETSKWVFSFLTEWKVQSHWNRFNMSLEDLKKEVDIAEQEVFEDDSRTYWSREFVQCVLEKLKKKFLVEEELDLWEEFQKIEIVTTAKWIDEQISKLINSRDKEIDFYVTEEDKISLVYERSNDSKYKIWIITSWLTKKYRNEIVNYDSHLFNNQVIDEDTLRENDTYATKVLDKYPNDDLPISSLLVYDLDLNVSDSKKLLKKLIQFTKHFTKLWRTEKQEFETSD